MKISMNIFFSAALLIFGYYWGYRTREISARDHDLEALIPFHDRVVGFLFPVLFSSLVLLGLYA